jgi:DNA-binding NarL/FixJ family response regulator
MTAVTPLRLFMVDDQTMLTEALSLRLSAYADLWVVGRTTLDDPRLPELVGRLRPDVLTVDPQPAGRNASKLLEGLAAQRATVRIVVLTGSLDTRMAVDAARAGVVAWVKKDSSVEEMTWVLRSARRGYSSYPPELLGTVLRELREDVRRARAQGGLLEVLSGRERDVLAGMTAGKPASRIAEELSISVETVRTYTRSILSKLRVRSAVEAISLACAAGLRTEPEIP